MSRYGCPGCINLARKAGLTPDASNHFGRCNGTSLIVFPVKLVQVIVTVLTLAMNCLHILQSLSGQESRTADHTTDFLFHIHIHESSLNDQCYHVKTGGLGAPDVDPTNT